MACRWPPAPKATKIDVETPFHDHFRFITHSDNFFVRTLGPVKSPHRANQKTTCFFMGESCFFSVFGDVSLS